MPLTRPVYPEISASYVIYIDDNDLIYAKNGNTGHIDYSGTDAVTVIQQALDALTEGGMLLVKEGTYHITESIIVYDSITIKGEGKSTIFRMVDEANAYCFRVRERIDVILADFLIEGNKENQNIYTAGIYIYTDSSRCLVHRVTVQNYYRDGILIENSTYCVVSECHLLSNGIGTNAGADWSGNGVRIDANYNIVDSCFCDKNAGFDIYIRSQDYNIVSNNVCVGDVGDTGEYAISVSEHPSHKTVVVGNFCEGHWTSEIVIGSASNEVTVVGNICINGNGAGIAVIGDAYRCAVIGNLALGNGGIGFNFVAHQTTCIGNVASGNGLDGFRFYNSDFMTVLGNLAEENDWNGFLVWGTHDSVLSNNIALNNSQVGAGTYDGIQSQDLDATYCLDNVVCQNRCTDTQGTKTQQLGIREGGNSNYNVYQGNSLRGNRAGAAAFAGAYNKVKHNVGYTTENTVLSAAFAIDGIAVITVTIAHGLSVTPALQDCALTVVEDTNVDDWEYGFVKVESVGAVNVVAKVNVTNASGTGGATAKLALRVGKP